MSETIVFAHKLPASPHRRNTGVSARCHSTAASQCKNEARKGVTLARRKAIHLGFFFDRAKTRSDPGPEFPDSSLIRIHPSRTKTNRLDAPQCRPDRRIRSARFLLISVDMPKAVSMTICGWAQFRPGTDDFVIIARIRRAAAAIRAAAQRTRRSF